MKNESKSVLLFVLSLPISYLFWIVFVGSFSLHELLVGLVAAFLAATGLVIVTSQYPARFSPSLAELLSFWRLSWYLLSGTWEVMLVAAKDTFKIKRAQSLFRVVNFRAGSKDDPHAAARRALAVIYTTAAPNFIVLGVNVPGRQLLFYQIQRSAVPRITRQLGAQV